MSNYKPTVIVTGGSGFIGSALCRHLIREGLAKVVNVDKLSYAANQDSLAEIADSPDYHFRKVDICDGLSLAEVFEEFTPDGIFHLAAESHVDRSIDGAASFIETNLLGTFRLLETARAYWTALPEERKSSFRFLHVSTDEVYGSLEGEGLFQESTPYDPSSPYSASKAGSDHLVTAWHRTYGLPTIVSNCANNYGPCQFPEKLIPLVILNCIRHLTIPVYGSGEQVRDWIFVEDQVRALWSIWNAGRPGEKYNVGGRSEYRNIDVVRRICRAMDEHSANPYTGGHEKLITHVADRPGHDTRYAIDANKLETELGWKAEQAFDTGIEKTVRWYLDNKAWWQPILDGSYSGERLGLGK